MKEGRGSAAKAPRKFFNHALCSHALSPKKTPFLRTEIFPLYTKSFVNERAKMKEGRHNYREIKGQDDNITEYTKTQNLDNIKKFTIRYCLHAKPEDKKKARETFCIIKVQ